MHHGHMPEIAVSGATINDIVLAYLSSQPLLTVPIVGCSSTQQLRERIKAAAIRLDAQELKQLRDA